MIEKVKYYSGLEVADLSKEIKVRVSKFACQFLSDHQKTMLQYKSEEVIQVIEDGMGVVAVDVNGDLLAFARLWSYVEDNSLMEFGSWVSAQSGNGIGSQVLYQAVSLGKKINPEVQIVAVVAEANKKVIGLIKYLGGKVLSEDNWPEKLPKLLGEGETSTVAIDMTDIQVKEAL